MNSSTVLGPCYSECGLQTGRVGVPCKFLSIAESQAPHQTPETETAFYDIPGLILSTCKLEKPMYSSITELRTTPFLPANQSVKL